MVKVVIIKENCLQDKTALHFALNLKFKGSKMLLKYGYFVKRHCKIKLDRFQMIF